MFTLYGDMLSGNCYKIKLLASLLKLPYQFIFVDLMAKQTQTDAFLAKNSNGMVPIIELPDGRILSESNAILHFLAADSALIPRTPFAHAQMLQWMFFEQYSHEPYIAVARFIAKYLNMPTERKAEYESKHSGGYRALTVMERQLSQKPFFVEAQVTLADIALYAYTHVAHEGGFDLEAYPAVRAWLARVEGLPYYVGMN